MLPGLFENRLRQCNHALKVIPSLDLYNRPSGLYVIKNCELVHICGVDNIDIPEREYVDRVGHIIKRGWRKAVQIVITQGHITIAKAEKAFKTRFGEKYLKRAILVKTKEDIDIGEEITKQSTINSNLYGSKHGNTVLKKDQLVDFAKALQKESGRSDEEDAEIRRQTIGS